MSAMAHEPVAGAAAAATAPRRPDTARFPVLDGLRGVGAIAVILDHVPPKMVHGFLPGRALSVDFFFVLSGFVIAHAYGQRLASGLSPAAFLRLRLIRLYPLYLLGLLVALPLAVYGARTSGRISAFVVTLCFAIILLPRPSLRGVWDNLSLYPLNGPAWSLFYELVANVVYAFVARLLTLRRLAALLPLLAFCLVWALYRHEGAHGPGYLWLHADAGLARVMFGFFAGVFIYRLRDVRRAPGLPAWLSVVIFLAVIAVPAAGAWQPPYEGFVSIVVFPLLVSAAANSHVDGMAEVICTTLGRLSYAIYMLHVPLLGALSFGLEQAGAYPPGVVFIGIAIALSIVAAMIADEWYDQPMRRWLSRFAPRQ